MTLNLLRAAYLVPAIADFYLAADTLGDLLTVIKRHHQISATK